MVWSLGFISSDGGSTILVGGSGMRSVRVVVFVVARLALSSMSQQEEVGDIWARGMTIWVSSLEKYEVPPCSGEWPTS